MVMEESSVVSSLGVLGVEEAPLTDDSSPTPSNVYLVGLEFVRQYYTVLNQGPHYLHRFYSEDSTFIHGVSSRDSRVAHGQQEIHKRIATLNFHNCHAKIRQVDSHDTLSNGVVIQVTGELSNNGQPMRRFMQTFVLAPQSPKRYYVRNDIFHYQDEVFSDDEAEGSTPADSSLEDDVEEEKQSEVNGSNSSLPIPSSPKAVVEEPLAPSPPPTQPVMPMPIIPQEISTPSGEEAPKTYANLFKNNTAKDLASLGNTTAFPPPSSAGLTHPKGATSPGNTNMVNVMDGGVVSPPQVSPQSSGSKGLPPRNPRGYNRPERQQDHQGRENEGRNVDRRENRGPPLDQRPPRQQNDETGSMDGDRRRPVNSYPDSHQLFVGNLPHNVDNTMIKEIFEQFGEIAEIKIQKPLPKSSGSKVPYFAFVVFEEAAFAQAALNRKLIAMRMPDGSQRRLNVEEKRARGGGPGSGYFSRDGLNSGNTNMVGNNGSGGGGRFDRGEQRPPQTTHTRTFRSNRGGSNNGPDDRNREGREGGGRGRNPQQANEGQQQQQPFQGGRSSPNNRNNFKR